MPCNSDYLEPNQREKNGSKVLALIEELEAGNLPDYYGHGFVGRNYYDGNLDDDTATLCSKLQELGDVSNCSLELQMWWRDHQEADKRRIENELKTAEKAKDRERAISKLTSYELKLLCIK